MENARQCLTRRLNLLGPLRLLIPGWLGVLVLTMGFQSALGCNPYQNSQDETPSPTESVADEFASDSSWQPVSDERLMEATFQWARESNLSPAQTKAIQNHLESVMALPVSARPMRIDSVHQAIALGRPEIADALNQLERVSDSSNPPDLTGLLKRTNESEFVRNHTRLLLGRWLTQNEFYDESLEQLSQIDIDQVLDRSTLLFYRSLAQHQLLKKEDCLETLKQLLEHEAALPRRYAVIGKMMQSDLTPLKPDSLDEVARMMNDIRRRTGFNRSGKIVLKEEADVIDKLDKLIEKLEQQQQQQQQQAGSSQGGQPMEDSRNTSDKGSGKVPNRQLPDGGNWGDLPPAKRAAALAEMAKDMPPHYRAAIEEYFRKLAKEDNR